MRKTLCVLLLSALLFVGNNGGTTSMKGSNITALVRDLESSDLEVCCQAAQELRDLGLLKELGPATHSVVSPLIRALSHPNRRMRFYAASALGGVGETAEPAIPNLLSMLINPHEDLEVRHMAATGLRGIGISAVPLLRQLLREPDLFVRREAADALGYLGSDSASAVPELIESLLDLDPDLRSISVESLENIGYSAIPALEKALKHSNGYARIYAAEALVGILPTSQDAVMMATEMLGNSIAFLRGRAAQVLRKAGQHAKIAVPALSGALSDNDAEVCYFAAEALMAIGSVSKSEIPALIKAYENDNPDIRFFVIATLGDIGSEAQIALPTVIKALRDSSEEVRKIASVTLNKINY